MRGDWLKGEGPWAGDAVNGTGMGDSERGTGDDRSDPGKHREENSSFKNCYTDQPEMGNGSRTRCYSSDLSDLSENNSNLMVRHTSCFNQLV